MTKKMPMFLFLLVLVCLLGLSTSTASGHVVSPGAVVRGVVSNQLDSAKLNKERIAWVWSSEIRVEIKVVPAHDSEIKGITFILEGNANAIATLHMQEGKEYREVASLTLRGRRQDFGLNEWVAIPQNPTFFLLQIGYKGEQGQSVPKVKVISLEKEIRIYSPKNGGEQEVDAQIDVIAWPGSKDTITLE